MDILHRHLVVILRHLVVQHPVHLIQGVPRPVTHRHIHLPVVVTQLGRQVVIWGVEVDQHSGTIARDTKPNTSTLNKTLYSLLLEVCFLPVWIKINTLVLPMMTTGSKPSINILCVTNCMGAIAIRTGGYIQEIQSIYLSE